MATPLANITGKVLLPNGAAPLSGYITVELSAPGTFADSGNHKTGGKFRVQLASDGSVEFDIIPNDSITPSGTHYKARRELTDEHGFVHVAEETWTVTGTGAQDIGDL